MQTYADTMLRTLIEGVDREPNELDLFGNLQPIATIESDYELDPVARISPTTPTAAVLSAPDEPPSFQRDTFDKMTSTKEERRIAEETAAEATPGSPAHFQAAQAATMPSVKQGREIRWYQQDNGRISSARMTRIEGGTHYMKPSAAKAYKAMQRAAKKDGINFAITDSYRTYDQQVALKAAKPTLAATPGKSNHGWGIALDINVNDPKVYNWLVKHGKKYGFDQPMDYEPWHWEYHGGYTGKHSPKGGSRDNRRPQQRVRKVVDREDIDPVNSLIHASTVFGTILAEVNEPPQRKTQDQTKENIETGGLKFVPKRFRPMFQEAADKYGISARLLAAMAQAESGFDPKAVSSAGAQGVMQVMPLHGMEQPFNARKNIMKGAEIFSSYLKAADGDLRRALAYYNAGPNAAPELIEERMRLYSDSILDVFFGRNR